MDIHESFLYLITTRTVTIFVNSKSPLEIFLETFRTGSKVGLFFAKGREPKHFFCAADDFHWETSQICLAGFLHRTLLEALNLVQGKPTAPTLPLLKRNRNKGQKRKNKG